MANMRRVLLALLAFSGLASTTHADELNDYAKHASCLISANNTYKLSAAVAGTLSRVAVKRADKVVKGQVIAELESAVEQAQLDAAIARAATDVAIRLKTAVAVAAEAKLARQQKLVNLKVTTDQSFEEAQAQAAVARAEVEQAEIDRDLAKLEVNRLRATLERRILRAPVDAVVTDVMLHEGEFADPANAVASVIEIEPLKVELYLSASSYVMVSAGMMARVTPQEPIGGVYEAEVISKDPQIDAASGLFLVQLRLPNPDRKIPAGIRCGVQF